MSNKIWNVQEIPILCPTEIVSEAEVYVKAVKNKIDRIMFLVQRLSVSNGSIQQFNFTALREAELEVEIYVESIAANLHSLVDVLAHIINVIVLKPLQSDSEYLSAKQISICKVKIKLANLTLLDTVKKQYIDEIVKVIDNLLNVYEFSYIAAFVNTIKHRRLLDTTLEVKFETGGLIDAGYKLDSFEYEGRNFPQTTCQDVILSYREKLIDLIFDLGNSINNYCRAVLIMKI